MNDRQPNPFDVLGVTPGASLLEIARARRRLAKHWHPDVAGPIGADHMRRINAAWEALRYQTGRDRWSRAAWASAAFARDGAVVQPWASVRDARPSMRGRDVHAASESRAGWIVLAVVSVLLAFIVLAGVVAALDGPSLPGRDSPVLQDNLD